MYKAVINQKMERKSLLILFCFLLLFSSLIGVGEANQSAALTPQADCSNGNFEGTYQTEDVALSGALFVTDDVLIRNNITLTITEGSQVTFCGEFQIRIEGGADFVAEGQPTQPITFDADNTAVKWRAIQFLGQGDHSRLRHVVLNNGGAFQDVSTPNAPIYINNLSNVTALASPVLDHVEIYNSGDYGLYNQQNSADRTPVSITNMTISHSQNGAILLDAEAVGGLGRGNLYTNNQPNHIQIRAGGGSRIYHSQQWRYQGVPFEVLEDGFGGFMVAAETADDPPAVLTLDPGITFLMHPDSDILVGTSLGRGGTLIANGTESEPITFTRLDDSSAPWRNLRLELYEDSYVELTHVNLAFGGGDGMLGMITQLGAGSLQMDHVQMENSVTAGFYGRGGTTTINNSRFTFNDIGLKFLLHDGVIIRNSTIQSNVTLGIENGLPNSLCIDAIANAWGSSDGPNDVEATADACGNGRSHNGSGDSVTTGVLYEPWLSGSGGLSNRGTISPDSYYVVADGIDAATVEIVLRDEQGMPLVNKAVQLNSTVGVIEQPAQLTDAAGRTTAVVTSTVTGFAYLTAYNLSDDTPVAGLGGVTFWQGGRDTGGLIDPDGAPYNALQLLLTGRPFQQGSPVGMRVPLQNSNPNPVDVTVVYGVTNLNVGTRFTPVYTASQTVQPGESWDASGVWLPNVTGHRCIQAAVTFDDGQTRTQQMVLSGSFNLQQNTNQNPCNPKLFNPGDALPKKPRGGPADLITVGETFVKLYNLAQMANRCLNSTLNFSALPLHWRGDDDYQEIVTLPVYTPPPIMANGGMTSAQADALTVLGQTSADLLSLNLALGATAQRMNWASQARDFVALDMQYEAYRTFANQYADKLDSFAVEIDALAQVSAGADLTYYLPEDYQTTRDGLDANGFEIDVESYYQQTGLSSELVETLAEDLVSHFDSAPFESLTLADAFVDIQLQSQTLAAELRDQYPLPTGLRANDGVPETVYVAPVVFEFEVGHTQVGNQTVELVVRPVNLPLDWTYELSASAFSLSEDEVAQATLTLYPGSEMLEDGLVQVAVEGYVNGELIGGVLMEHYTPYLTPRTAHSLFLPVMIN